MRKLFDAIKKNDIITVKELLAKKPDLLFATAKKPPRSDDGQSTLQVALKNGRFEIAEYLISLGAEVNFIESADCANDWRTPVLHDAIRAAVFTCRSNCVEPDGSLRLLSSKIEADHSFAILEKMLFLGADVNTTDSYGNTALDRAILDASQVLPSYHHGEKRALDDRKLTSELKDDLTRIFKALFAHGADKKQTDRIYGIPVCEHYQEQPVGMFLK